MKLQVQETTVWHVGGLQGEERVIGLTATMQISIKCKSLPLQGQLDAINKVVATPNICHTKVAEELWNFYVNININ
jgi:hypothetical protein